MTDPEALHLPPGYRLDDTDPDVLLLRRGNGTVVACFSVQGATRESIEEAAWEDHRARKDDER